MGYCNLFLTFDKRTCVKGSIDWFTLNMVRGDRNSRRMSGNLGRETPSGTVLGDIRNLSTEITVIYLFPRSQKEGEERCNMLPELYSMDNQR